MKFAWLPYSLVMRQEQGSEKETAEVKTRKPYGMPRQKRILSKDLARSYCLIIENNVLATEFPEQGAHSGGRLLLSSMARSVASADVLCHQQCPYGQ